MNKHLCIFFLLSFLHVTVGYSQESNYVWWNPVKNPFPSIEGQAWRDVKNPYDRLPARAEKLVRQDVWDLSQHQSRRILR